MKMRNFKATCTFCNWKEALTAPSLLTAKIVAVKKHHEQPNVRRRLLCIPDIKVEETE